ncbi:MAG: glutamine-synthetase adenylyltransferase [Pseudomonadota bacterium]
MTFAARVSRLPLPYDPDLGVAALAHLPDCERELRPLIAGAAGSSPYLGQLIAQEASWLAPVLCAEPEPAMLALVNAARCAKNGAELRRLKRRAALLIALADLGGFWGITGVTGALTAFADAATGAVLDLALAQELRRGKLPGMEHDDIADGAGMVVLAMGKMGAGELNYSSDIDLICLFDETRFDSADRQAARAGFVRATRQMAAILGKVTPDGYVFRTDLRLRPDAATTPVCLSTRAALEYYEAEGRTWERAAYIKARPVAGNLTGGAQFLRALTPFVWRRHLDFAAIHETQTMRQRIQDHKALYSADLGGRNIKLGRGGIREIEFFAQTRQLIAGGRDATLRQRRTVRALEALAGAGWVEGAEAKELHTAYDRLRQIEHRLQMVGDAQTHSLPKTPEAFDRLARLSGSADTDAYRADLSALLSGVETRTSAFFLPAQSAPDLQEISDHTRSIVDRWRSYPALRSERGRAIFRRLEPDLLARLSQAARPDEALANFDGFLRGLPAGVQLFSLFEANPALIDLIVDISATAPALSRYLSRHAGVLDSVIDGAFFAPWPSPHTLGRQLQAQLSGRDHEDALDAARVWQKEWHFRIGVHLLRGVITPEQAAQQYSDLAHAVVATLWPLVQALIAERHGPASGRGGAVLAMGSLGAETMAASSDLDLLVIYDADDAAGPGALDARAWYAKATKALIAALSAPTAHGVLYAVDMRLRPSGRQGPVATSLTAFETYQKEQAWTWEHLALTRARVVAAPNGIGAEIEAIRDRILAKPRDAVAVRNDTAKMRQRLREAGPQGGDLDVKTGPGGAQDIALLAQAGALLTGSPARRLDDQLAAATVAQLITNAEARTLSEQAAVFEKIRQATMLISEKSLDPGDLGQGGRDFIARCAGASDWDSLLSQSARARQIAAAIVDAVLPLPEPDP